MFSKFILALAIVTFSLPSFGQATIEAETYAFPGQAGDCNPCAPTPKMPTGPLAPLTPLSKGNINMTNSGANGASLNGPGFGGAVGNICANVYAFSPDEQLVSCCSCLITPNGLVSLSVDNDLLSNTLTGIIPSSVTVTLIPTLAGPDGTGTNCTNSAALAGTANFPFFGQIGDPPRASDSGLVAWGTRLLKTPVANTFAVTEGPFLRSFTSQQELASLTNRCTNIIGNGSSFGICRSCRVGGLRPSTN